MNDALFLCDDCDTLAIVSVDSDTITINPCKCVTLDWNN
jgi:hypothetical protein